MRCEIDVKRRIARFSGPGTFEFKEDIKGLGNARWRNDLKTWEVSGFELTIEALAEIFPGIEVQEIGDRGEGAVQIETAVELSLTTVNISAGADAVPAGAMPRRSRARRSSAASGADTGAELPSAETQPSVPKGLSVGQLLGIIRELVQRGLPDLMPVYGVVKSVRGSGDRRFIELANHEDPSQSISCVIWSDAPRMTEGLEKAGFKLEPELQVMFEVRASVNVKDGRSSFHVASIVTEYTLAKLQGERERTNDRLRAEGLFALNKSKQLPFLPRTLGILTSSEGTVITDFRSSLDESRFGFRLYWFPVRVQGKEARASIIRGLEVLASVPDLDAVLLFRGGGSKADLAVFNDYEVAKAICRCPLPVVAAIGHQEDQSSAQDVARIALGVPKDVGRFFADIVTAYRSSVRDAAWRIEQAVRGRTEGLRERVELLLRTVSGAPMHRLASAERDSVRLVTDIRLRALSALTRSEERVSQHARVVHAGAGNALGRAQAALRSGLSDIRSYAAGVLHRRESILPQLGARVSAAVAQQLSRGRERLLRVVERTLQSGESRTHVVEAKLDGIAQLIDAVAPERQLARGFSIVRNEKGEFVRTGAQLETGAEVEIQFSDGVRNARIR